MKGAKYAISPEKEVKGMVNQMLDVKVDKVRKLDGEGKVKAFCDLIFGNLFLIRGFKVVNGEKGMFVGMPQQRSSQGRWFNIFMPATEEIRQYINEVVLQAYEAQA